MQTRPGFEPERTVALAILVLALLGVGYSLFRPPPAAATRELPAPIAPAATPISAVRVMKAPAPAAPEPAPKVEPAATPATPELAFPLPGFEHVLRNDFHEKRGARRHMGVDILAPRGTPVRAVDDGRIAKLYRGPLAGIAIYQFDAVGSRVYFYAHLDRYAKGLKEGQAVKRGQVIGYVGSTGNAPEGAPHLHFETREVEEGGRWWKGKAVNPYPLLQPPARLLAGDG